MPKILTGMSNSNTRTNAWLTLRAPARIGNPVGGVLSDIFGKNGRRILDGLAEGASAEDILAGLSSHVTRKRADLEGVLSLELSPHARTALKDLIDKHDRAERAAAAPAADHPRDRGRGGRHADPRTTRLQPREPPIPDGNREAGTSPTKKMACTLLPRILIKFSLHTIHEMSLRKDGSARASPEICVSRGCKRDIQDSAWHDSGTVVEGTRTG